MNAYILDLNHLAKTIYTVTLATELKVDVSKHGLHTILWFAPEKISFTFVNRI